MLARLRGGRRQLFGWLSLERSANVTCVSAVLPPRLYAIVTWSPDWWLRICWASSAGRLTAVPSTAVITSSAWRPADSAGLPPTTSTTRTPCGSVDACVATPRNTPLTWRGTRGRFGPSPGSRGERPSNGRSLRAFSLSPLEAVARPSANAPPKRRATTTRPMRAATAHFGISHPPRPPGGAAGAPPSVGGGGGRPEEGRVVT